MSNLNAKSSIVLWVRYNRIDREEKRPHYAVEQLIRGAMRQGRYFLVGNFMWRGSYFFLRGIVCAQECYGKAISSGMRSTEPASVSNHKGGLLKWSTNEYNCFKTWANVGVDCPNWELVRDVERGEVFDASSLKGEIADLRKTLKKC